MFYDPRVTKTFLYTKPIDCRKAHSGLIFLVTQVLQKELRSGAIFLFISRDRKTAKALKWDGTGAVIFHKRLERGRVMQFRDLKAVAEISAEELLAICAGAQVRLDLKI